MHKLILCFFWDEEWGYYSRFNVFVMQQWAWNWSYSMVAKLGFKYRKGVVYIINIKLYSSFFHSNLPFFVRVLFIHISCHNHTGNINLGGISILALDQLPNLMFMSKLWTLLVNVFGLSSARNFNSLGNPNILY